MDWSSDLNQDQRSTARSHFILSCVVKETDRPHFQLSSPRVLCLSFRLRPVLRSLTIGFVWWELNNKGWTWLHCATK